MTNELEQKIRERAYALWELDGRVDGRAEAHWLAAAEELTAALADAVPSAPAADQEEIIVAAKPKAKRRSTKAAAAQPVTPGAAPAPRRRRSSTTPLN
jgi:hypothetical protein